MTPRSFDAIVIGSGLGGLSAAGLLTQAGLRVLVLERHEEFGGAATTYMHAGLAVEASLHEMSGTGRDGPVTEVLRALGALDDVPLVPVGDFYEARSHLLGEPFVMPHSMEESLRRCLERFPGHSRGLREYHRLLAALFQAVVLMGSPHPVGWWVAHAPSLPWKLWPAIRHMRSVLAEVLEDLFGDDEAVKLALSGNIAYYTDDPASIWFEWWAYAQAAFLAGGGRYVRGGSHVLSDRLVQAITDRGGACESSRAVTGIVLDGSGRACAVEHVAAPTGDDPRRDDARVVIGNASPHALAPMLPEEHRAAFAARYARLRPSGSISVVSLGFRRPPADHGVRRFTTAVFPSWMDRLAQLPDSAGLTAVAPASQTPYYLLTDYAQIDAGLPSTGMTLGQISFQDRIANWTGLDARADHDRRERWMDQLLGSLEEQFPGLAGAVAHREMVTPRDIRDRLGTPDGAILGFAPDPPDDRPPKPRVRTAVDGLLLASAYTTSGSFEGAIAGGALAAREALAQCTASASAPAP